MRNHGLTNQQRVGVALEHLREGLAGFIGREVQNRFQDQSLAEAQRRLGTDKLRGNKPVIEWDVAALLRLMWKSCTLFCGLPLRSSSPGRSAAALAL